MSKTLIYLLLAFTLASCQGCKTPDTGVSSRPASPAATTQADLGVINCPAVDQFLEWVGPRSKELAAQLNITEPKTIRVGCLPPLITGSNESGVIYICGYYISELQMIVVWVLGPHNNCLSFEEMKQTFYHEYLHHLDFLQGVDYPADHNLLFERRIRDYGWNSK